MSNKINATAIALTMSLAAMLTCSGDDDGGGNAAIDVSANVTVSQGMTTHNYAYATVQYAASGTNITEVGVMYGTSLGRLNAGAFDTYTEGSNSDEFGIVSGIPSVTGSFGADLTGLKHSTTYYVIPYLKLDKPSSDFYKGYFVPTGGHKEFTTREDESSATAPPAVSNTGVSDITFTTAKLSASVTAAGRPGFTDRGFCYGTEPNPAINGTCARAPGTEIQFSQQISGLSEYTTYYVRAYITNESFGTRYGTETSFITRREATATGFTFTDARDGQVYRAVDIDGMVWMAQNLNYAADSSWCYENYGFMCEQYGRLYSWDAAMEACPAGWHLPSRVEWADFMDKIGGAGDAGTKLKADNGWSSGNGTDDYGFTALPGGERGTSGSFAGEKSRGGWWSSTLGEKEEWWGGNSYVPYKLEIDAGTDVRESIVARGNGFAVRCVQDGSTPTYTLTVNATVGGSVSYSPVKASYNNGEQVTVTAIREHDYLFDGWTGGQVAHVDSITTTVIVTSDMTLTANFKLKGVLTDSRDGQSYYTVTIGTQTWMAENLNYDAPGSACYNNAPDSCAKYGRLYNWAMVMNGALSSTLSPSGVRGICPEGWHVPSNAEWETLEKYVDPNASGNTNNAGTKLKSKSGWYNNRNGTDDHGFSALPGGHGGSGDYFAYAGSNGYWWSATEYDATKAYLRRMDDYGSVTSYNNVKSDLYSVRCVRDD
ncbi:MAG: hypothetical protein FWB85_11740 [Chitinispirillia bacterium]|nr:hypothetical protein [Chitinispirillia bacterium]